MAAISGVIFCFAFILGLLFTGISGTVRGIPIGAILPLLFGILAAFLIPYFWRVGVKSWVWAIAGVIAFLAGLYFQWRLPYPGAIDVSRFIEDPAISPTVALTGKIDTSPRLTQSQRIQFELKAAQLKLTTSSQSPIEAEPATVTGRVYVTVPLLQGTGLYPGQTITVSGSLYLPKPAANPGGFNFAQYLAQRGIFAGLNGKTIDRTQNRASLPVLWNIRQRIIRAQVRGAGVPEGVLLSAMVMGGRSVDVPHSVRESFRIAGLSHTLAASGAHVAVFLGVVMALTRRCSVKWRVGSGLGALLLFVGLAGLQPSVLRAAIMGGAALTALSAERKVKPLGALLVTATILLAVNPVWVWDLGFQLSFMATLGLLVTVPILSKWLDWLPKLLIPWFAVPIAAHLWTLPILLYTFGVVSVFSILINILASPLFTIASLGGVASGLAALIHPEAGRLVAVLLYYPAHSFIALAEWGSQLPGSSFAVGTIGIVQLALLYGLMLVVWRWERSHRYWWVAALLGVSLVAIPVGYGAMTRVQVTVLATSSEPVLVIQERGTVALINAGSESDVRFTLLPFLQSQGINQIHQAIDLTPSTETESWQRLAASLPIQHFYGTRPDSLQNDSNQTAPLTQQQSLAIGSITVQLLSSSPTVLALQMGEQTWLLLDAPTLDASTLKAFAPAPLPPAQVLLGSGESLSLETLEAVQPTIAIANARSLPAETQSWLETHAVTTYLTERDGAIQWTPHKGFRAIVHPDSP